MKTTNKKNCLSIQALKMKDNIKLLNKASQRSILGGNLLTTTDPLALKYQGYL